MRRVGRIAFLLGFALLQCVAPLAHAHVRGDAAMGALHFHFGQIEHMQHDQGSRVSGGSHAVEASELPVIKVPDGKFRAKATFAFTSPWLNHPGAGLVLPAMLASPARVAPVHADLPSPYLKHYSQAPPRRA
jgi:hypothetical protein